MLNSILPFTPEAAEKVSGYCIEHTNGVPKMMEEVWEYTAKSFKEADKMSSPLQGSWMIFLAQDRKAKRILDIGTFSGYSALAWYEGTRETHAEIITLEVSPEMIAVARGVFDKYNVNDRITLIEGPAAESLEKLTGSFDLIFVDANKDGYEGYVNTILDRNLLSQDGLIMCDNVFARGMTISTSSNPILAGSSRSYWTECGKALRQFNAAVNQDPRIDVVMLPVFDGVSLIKLKNQTAEPEANGRNTTASNGTNPI
ncbi:uncharacterized protein PADG_02839 [Paracoccidioides brasiliensis Pb18]|uniref:O-methyltransferase n=2 Tax=Paracoccidioides brasiliensis TaxID=121759 RepID=C1G6N4_PARBD|nr:uncharacterized protein PADG_02839 [Paracoccidioides brasiliensis Pb18]EEH46741.2 hypothetical protein PADG_02839 [Paracoccidioides brasiliensis Pb18]ODH43623.1 hypothetical protein ACO22_00967 [Paracoccidioides brasiliensis]ODH45525.1 hypothetical protein GX48_08397 [Paracoccidioides brasiliensis]